LHHRNLVSAEVAEGVADARDILNSSDEGIIVTNGSGKITRFNQMAEHIFGYNAEYIIGRDFLMLIPDDLHKAHRRTMSGSVSKITNQTHELVARRSDGTSFALSLTVKPTREKGKPAIFGMARDISALKLAELTSRKNQQLMEFLLKSSPIVFYTCNIEDGSSFTYVSPNVEELFGYPPEAITNAPAFLLRHVHPNDRDQIQSRRPSLLKKGRGNLEYRLKMPDGSYRWINDSHTMGNDENGKPCLLIGRWTDINEHKEAEVELALKEESLNTCFKCTGVAGWDWTINSGRMSWSGQTDEQLGFSAAQITDFDDLSSITHPSDRDDLMTAFRQCLVQDEALDIEFRIRWADKSIHWIHMVGESVKDDSGSPIRMVGSLSDITDQKQIRVASSRPAKQAS